MYKVNITPPVFTFSQLERFQQYVDKSDGQGPEGTCWEWRAARTSRGYGCFKQGYRGRNLRAHRVALMLAIGRWPTSLVLHRCDNPPCCNPAHLFEGTNAENSADMVAKGRTVTGDKNPMRKYPDKVLRGSKNGNTRLSETDVLEMRRLNAGGIMGYRRLARKYGIGPTTARRILKNETWKHI